MLKISRTSFGLIFRSQKKFLQDELFDDGSGLLQQQLDEQLADGQPEQQVLQHVDG